MPQPAQTHPAADASEPDDGRRPCARGDWCTSDETVSRWENGQRVVTPVRGYRAFCEDDRAEIRDAIAAFPGQWDKLAAELGKHASAGRQGGGKHGKASAPPLEYRADVDALMRLLTDVLISWNDRVAAIPGVTIGFLADPDPDRRFRDGYRILATAARQLRPRLDTLLGLEPAPMVRTVSHAGPEMLARFPGAWPVAVTESGEVIISTRLDGARAGLEILHLDYRCHSVLGETDPKPESLAGIRCYGCNRLSLRRADPPHKADDPEWYSQCKRKVCGDKMTEPEYRKHVTRLAATAGGKITTPCLD